MPLMAFFQFAVTDADKRRIRNAFAHYVAPSLLTQIENNADRLRLGGEVRELTVMFSDVRNYSAIGEKLAPTELVRLLNTLFAALGAAILEHLGTIDKFMGDAVMAFWNAPLDVERHALRACRAALDMRAALADLNQAPVPSRFPSASALPRAQRWWAIWGSRRGSTIPASATPSTSPAASKAPARGCATISS